MGGLDFLDAKGMAYGSFNRPIAAATPPPLSAARTAPLSLPAPGRTAGRIRPD